MTGKRHKQQQQTNTYVDVETCLTASRNGRKHFFLEKCYLLSTNEPKMKTIEKHIVGSSFVCLRRAVAASVSFAEQGCFVENELEKIKK